MEVGGSLVLRNPLRDLGELRIKPRKPLEGDCDPTRSYVAAVTLCPLKTFPADGNPVCTPRRRKDELFRVVTAGDKLKRITFFTHRGAGWRDVVNTTGKVLGDRSTSTGIDRGQQFDSPL